MITNKNSMLACYCEQHHTCVEKNNLCFLCFATSIKVQTKGRSPVPVLHVRVSIAERDKQGGVVIDVCVL